MHLHPTLDRRSAIVRQALEALLEYRAADLEVARIADALTLWRASRRDRTGDAYRCLHRGYLDAMRHRSRVYRRHARLLAPTADA